MPTSYPVDPLYAFDSTPYLIDLLYAAESGARRYEAYNQGTVSKGGTETITNLTLGEIMERQALPKGDPDRLFAVGAPQIIPDTMKKLMGYESLDLTPDMEFTPELQNYLTLWGLLRLKRKPIFNYVRGEGSLSAALRALCLEWASFSDPLTGKTHYPQGGNKASVTVKQASDSLRKANQVYQAEIAKRPNDVESAWELAICGELQIEPWKSPEEPPKPVAAVATTDLDESPVAVEINPELLDVGWLTDTGAFIVTPTHLKHLTPDMVEYLGYKQLGKTLLPTFKARNGVANPAIPQAAFKPSETMGIKLGFTNASAFGLISISILSAFGVTVPDIGGLNGNETLGVLAGGLIVGLRRLAERYLTTT